MIVLKIKVLAGIAAIVASHTLVTSLCAHYGIDQGYAHIVHGFIGGWFVRSIV